MEEEMFTYSTDYVPTSYSYPTTAPTAVDSAAGALIAIMVILIWFAIVVGTYVLGSWLLSRVFKKFGEKPGRAWIPIYNTWKFLELGGQKGFWLFVPGASVIFMTLSAYNLGKKLGKSDAFVLLYLFLAPVWLIIVGSKDNPVVAGSAESITPENQFGQQPAPSKPTASKKSQASNSND